MRYFNSWKHFDFIHITQVQNPTREHSPVEEKLRDLTFKTSVESRRKNQFHDN